MAETSSTTGVCNGGCTQCWNTTTDIVPSPDALGYVVGFTIGSGSYAKVKAAWSPTLKKQVAIKIVDKLCSKEKHLAKFLSREIAVLAKLDHPHILKTHQIVQTSERCYIIMELAHNGDLLDHINDRRKLTEGESRFFFQQICEAVLYCHQSSVVHRDLKCENVMLDKNFDVKLGDFGFALDLQDDNLSTPCGSKSYAAPEVHMVCEDRRSIDAKKADVWSLGVVLFAMVTGNLPFLGKTTSQSFRNKCKPVKCPDYLSSSLKNFLNFIFTTNPDNRPGVHELLTSAWTLTLPLVSPLQTNHLTPLHTKYTIDTCFSKSTASTIRH